MTTSIWMTCLELVRDEVRGLQLWAIPDDNIKLIKVDHARHGTAGVTVGEPPVPGVIVLPSGPETIPLGRGTSAHEDVGYPVAVTFMDRDLQTAATIQDQESNYDRRLLWREQVRNHFMRKSFRDGTLYCETEPGTVIDLRRWLASGIWASTLIVRCWSRELVRA